MGESFYERRSDRFLSTRWTRGPWDPNLQHAGPPAALAGRAVEALGGDGWRTARFTFEILRPIPIEPLRAEARVVRPGKRVRFCEATLSGDAGELARASAWQIAAAGEPVMEAGAQEPPFPGPEAAAPLPVYDPGEERSYFRGMEWRFARGSFFEPGPASAWMRMAVPLVDGEEPSPLARVLAAADSGNGISSELDFTKHLFINVELSLHLTRVPDGEWVCLDAVTRIDPGGIGLTESILWDERGRIGRSDQSLLVAPR